jgi:hypothetical protein
VFQRSWIIAAILQTFLSSFPFTNDLISTATSSAPSILQIVGAFSIYEQPKYEYSK